MRNLVLKEIDGILRMMAEVVLWSPHAYPVYVCTHRQTDRHPPTHILKEKDKTV